MVGGVRIRGRRAEKKLRGWSMKICQGDVGKMRAQGCILKALPTPTSDAGTRGKGLVWSGLNEMCVVNCLLSMHLYIEKMLDAYHPFQNTVMLTGTRLQVTESAISRLYQEMGSEICWTS